MTNILTELLSEFRTWGALAVALAFALFLLSVKNRILHRLEEHGHMRPAMAGRFRVIGRWVVLGGLGLVALHHLGWFENVWAIATTALAAVAVGVVAIWSILSNALAAVLILVYRPFRIGDVELLEVNAASGLRGRVLDMNLMFTLLQQKNEAGEPCAIVTVPNNLVFQKLVRIHAVRASRASFYSAKPSERPEPPGAGER